MSRAVIRSANEGELRSFYGGGIHTWKVTAEDSDGSIFVFQDAVVRGKCTPLHRHPEHDEIVYVIEGSVLYAIDGEERRAEADSVIFVPRGTPHAFIVVSQSAHLLCMQTPGGGQAFYRDASAPADGAENRPDWGCPST